MSLEINTDDFWKEQQQQVEDWRSKLPKCGCGRVGRYETPTGLACNKYMRCDNAEYLAEQVKTLTAENARLRAALEQYQFLIAAFFHQYDSCIPHQGMMAEAIDALRMYDPIALKGQP